MAAPGPGARGHAGVRPRARAQDRILDATLELLAEHGFAGLTVDAVAARAGVGRATIYRHWGSRAALVIAAMRTLSRPLPLPDTGNLRDDLVALSGAFARILSASDLGRVLPALVDAAERDAELARLHSQVSAERRRCAGVILERAVGRGELPSGTDVELAVDLLAGPLVYRRLVTRRRLDRRYVEKLVDAVLAACQASSR